MWSTIKNVIFSPYIIITAFCHTICTCDTPLANDFTMNKNNIEIFSRKSNLIECESVRSRYIYENIVL